MQIFLTIGLLFAVLNLFISASYGARQGKDDESVLGAGLEAFQRVMNDPEALKAAYAQLKDPEVMKDVQSMMKDPRFLSEMNRLKENPLYQSTLAAAKEMYGDPTKTAKILSEINDFRNEEHTEEDISAAQLGLSELSKTVQNPKLLAEALEDLKNPDVAAEVQKLMKDPDFQREMKEITDSPQFQAAMTRASVNLESIAEDPKKLANMMDKINGLMGKKGRQDQ